MTSKHNILLISLTAALAVVLAAAGPVLPAVRKAAPAPKKAATAKKPTPATPKLTIPVGPKKLTVVTGRPFETPPATGASKIQVTMCAEETEPASFTVRYSQPLRNVRVIAYSDLVGPGKIARANVEVSQVSGDFLSSTTAPSGVVYALADIAAAPTQFWVKVTVPWRTPLGLYKGAIGFYQENKLLDVTNLEVKVLPMRLVGSSKQYMLLTSTGPTCPQVGPVEGDEYTKLLDAFHRLGIKVVALNTSAENMPAAIAAHKATGELSRIPLLTYFNRDVVPTMEEVQAAEEARKASGILNMLYLVRANPSTPEEIDVATKQAQVFRKAGVRSVVSVSDETALATLEPLVDGVAYDIATPYAQALLSGTQKRTSSKWQWYWWDARQSALRNRMYAGVALWKSGLDGCLPVWAPSDTPDMAHVSSLLGEALREGVDDTRYLTAFMKAVRELKDLKRMKDKDYIAATEAYLAGFMNKPIDQLKHSDAYAMRAKIAEFTMKLESML